MSQDEAVRAMHIVSLFLLSSKTRCRGIDVESLLAVLLPPCLPHTTPPFLRRFRLVNVSSLLAARNENRFVLLFFFVSRVSLLSSLTSSSTRLHELTLALSSRIAYSNHNTCPSSIGLHLWANFADCRYRLNYLSYLWLKSLRSYSCLGCLPYFPTSGPAYAYQANLKGGKVYVGMATSKPNLKKRIQTQLSGSKGASSVCRNSKPISVTRVFKHANVKAAKKAETKRYHSTKAILGANKVRGAGHTKAFPKKK